MLQFCYVQLERKKRNNYKGKKLSNYTLYRISKHAFVYFSIQKQFQRTYPYLVNKFLLANLQVYFFSLHLFRYLITWLTYI